MLNLKPGSRPGTLIVVLAGLIFAPFAFADDADDVRNRQYANWRFRTSIHIIATSASARCRTLAPAWPWPQHQR